MEHRFEISYLGFILGLCMYRMQTFWVYRFGKSTWARRGKARRKAFPCHGKHRSSFSQPTVQLSIPDDGPLLRFPDSIPDLDAAAPQLVHMVFVDRAVGVKPPQAILAAAICTPSSPADIPPVQEGTKRREELLSHGLVFLREVRAPARRPPDRHVPAVAHFHFGLEPCVEPRCAP